jgi:precorrin-6Y C5,15-methyltransferase (decarboxylating)
MLSIAGLGMGEPRLDSFDIKKYDRVIVDKSVKLDGENILKLSYKEAKEFILKNAKDMELLYLVSGSPLFFSAGVILSKLLPKELVKIIPNISSKEYLLQKLFISESELSVVTLHGRDRVDLEEFLKKRYTFVLCDEKSLERLKIYLKWLSNDDYKITIGYKLGYKDEAIKQIELSEDSFDLKKPYVLLIERLFENKIYSDDSEFETQRGMITKRFKRDMTLSSLELKPNEIFWDVGAGSGSCAIDAYKRYKVKTYLFENKPNRIEFIKQNLKKHRVVDATLVEGDAQNLFEDISDNPDKIFIGGGGEEVIKKLPYLYKRLNKNGIILINAVTLKNLSSLIQLLDELEFSYEVISYSLTTYKDKLNLIEPQRELFSIKLVKID